MTFDETCLIITAFATSIGALRAMQEIFDVQRPYLKKGCIVENRGKRPIIVSHIECTYGTFGYRKICENYEIIFEDSGKNRIDVDKLLMYGESIESLPDVVFIDGVPCEPMVEIVRHFWPVIGTSHWHVRMTPRKRA